MAPKGNERRLHRNWTDKIPVIPATYTLAETQSFLLAHKGQFDSIDYIYVTTADGKLVGVFSIKDLYRLPAPTRVSEIYKKRPLVMADFRTHNEEIAYLALSHGIKAIPIVDADRKLLGAVPHDIVNRIVYRELREDILRLAGVDHAPLAIDSVMEIPLLLAVKHRLPWLVAGTGGGILIAQIIQRFQQTLTENLILASFIPLVVYIADAVGTQLEAFAVRDMALFRKLDFIRYFGRNFLTVAILALVLAVGVSLISLVVYRRADMSWVLGLSVAGAALSALFSGLVVPFLFRQMKLDPANASGPLGTIFQDGISVVIYLSIASLLL